MSKDISRKMSVDTASEVEEEPKKIKKTKETNPQEIIEILTKWETAANEISKDLGKIKKFLSSTSFNDLKVKKQKVVREPQPLSGYQYFLKIFREENKGLDNKTIFRDGAKKWQALPDGQHEKYKELAKDEFYKAHPDAERKEDKKPKTTSKSKKPAVEPVPITPKVLVATSVIESPPPSVKSEKKKHHHKHKESISEGDVAVPKKRKHHDKKEKEKEKKVKVDEDAPTESE